MAGGQRDDLRHLGVRIRKTGGCLKGVTTEKNKS